ncbi:RHS repeat-associated core domain-containing protein [uncultured Psychroserpens sp.]|uniref:RHS repeat-associated core domain-containing protein n=1 Tax=uncultured Psychroserpens sp. TaxID=255436 RepID=UPI00263521C3|nr:RHS repeat-associated core domain-containing protein [uncultured Psychroserpens sp.]
MVLDYYLFGLTHKGYNNNVSANSNSQASKYKYNGKELNEELGLNWHDFGWRNYDASLGRWMNIDPLAEKYYDKSSYNYTLNNPVFFVDPDGRFTIEITGNKSEEALGELQKSVSSELNLSMDDSGRVSYSLVDSEATLSKDAQKLVDAINDTDVHVNLSATDYDFTSTDSGILLGAFMGNEMTGGFSPPPVDSSLEGNGIVNQVETFQEINVTALSKMDQINNKPGQTTLHEATESYIAGKLVQSSGKATGFGSVSGGSDYASAIYYMSHSAATPQSGNIGQAYFDGNGTQLDIRKVSNIPQVRQTRFYTGPNVNQPFHTVNVNQ